MNYFLYYKGKSDQAEGLSHWARLWLGLGGGRPYHVRWIYLGYLGLHKYLGVMVNSVIVYLGWLTFLMSNSLTDIKQDRYGPVSRLL